MDKEHNGARAALDETLKNTEPPSARAPQLTLDIEAPVRQPRDEFDPAETHAADLLGLPKVAEKRALVVSANNAGKGRPRGRHNHRTQAWVDHLLKRYPSPLETLAQIQASPIDALAAELHCTRLEALIQKRHAAEALAPFVHQKLASIEIKPPGHPGGEPTLLQLTNQDGVETIGDVIEAVALRAAIEPASDPSVEAPLYLGADARADRHCALLPESDPKGPRTPTLSIEPQTDRHNKDSQGHAQEVVEATQNTDVQAAVDRALSVLAELARSDERTAQRIRDALADVLT
jgi:hypothetical protein